MRTSAPSPARHRTRSTLHGRTRVDDYAWLKHERWRDVMRDPSLLSGPIRDYLEAENAYTRRALADVAPLEAQLFSELRGRIKEDDSTVPARDGPYEYYVRFREGGQHPVACRRATGDAAREEVLIDGDALAASHGYFHLGDHGHSPDHGRFAWSEDSSGAEIYRIRFKDLASGRELDDVVDNASGSFEWCADGASVLYTVLDENHRPCKVCRHELGTPAGADRVVYEEADPGFFVGVDLTESRRFLVIDAHDHVTSEVRLLDAHAPASVARLVASRRPGVEYSVTHHGDRLLILTNADGAVDFKIVEVPLETPAREHWRDLIAHRPGTLIVTMELFAGHLVRLERVDGLPRLVIRELASGEEHAIEFEEETYSLGLAGGYEFDTTRLRFAYSSMTTPEQIFDYDMETRERVLLKTQQVPSGHDPGDYVTWRELASSHDGEQVPISLLRRADTPLDGSAPVLLYGYGAYGISIPAAFSTLRLSLVDRGFVYGIAHVRGGMERGYRWYREGKLEHKINTFLDFIAAAEHLVEVGITRPGLIAAQGGSAGGMLVGAVANMRSDLFRALVAEVPFVDVLNTMCDASLPLTPPEWPEWGNPIEDVEAYDRIASYSPYDNVGARAYPHILVTAGLTDPRVTYWEPAKWVAKLRRLKTDDNLLLLKTNMEAGHGGAAGRLERLEETAMVYAFLLKVFARA